MAPDPEKARRTPDQSVEYQPDASQESGNPEPENSNGVNERRNLETDVENKENSV